MKGSFFFVRRLDGIFNPVFRKSEHSARAVSEAETANTVVND
jgi:hypothetical protein